MKKISLSDRKTKFNVIAITLLTLAVAIVVIVLNSASVVVVVVASVLGAIALLIALFYMSIVLSERVEIEGNTLTERCLNKSSQTDTASVAAVLTAQRTVGHTTTRAILLIDKDNITICTLNCFCSGNGYNAELIAMEIAKALNVEFIPTVDPSLYGKKSKSKTNVSTQQVQTPTNFDEQDDNEIQ